MDGAVDGAILLVGDGDFSLSTALLRYHSAAQITTSSLETETSITKHRHALRNRELLLQQGVEVLCDIDASTLQSYPPIAARTFHRIIFNFPHVGGKSNNKKNRKLIGDFFSSAVTVLHPEGEIMVTLCKGQGGTPADKPQRLWADSWQVVSMAANARLILSEIHPFIPTDYPGYICTGFRSQDKWFHIEGALTHVFSRSQPISEPDRYDTMADPTPDIPQHLNRNLFAEPHHPLCILRQQVVEGLARIGSTRVIPPGDDLLLEGSTGPVVPLQEVIERVLGDINSSKTDSVVDFRAVSHSKGTEPVSHSLVYGDRLVESPVVVSKIRSILSLISLGSPREKFQVYSAHMNPEISRDHFLQGADCQWNIDIQPGAKALALTVGRAYQQFSDSPNRTGLLLITVSLDKIMCAMCGIQDPRMSRSRDKRFLSQFTDSAPVCSQKFSPFSLYPKEFCHDMSFWENPDVEFNGQHYNRVVSNVAGDSLLSVSLLDVYRDEDTNRSSRCYRLTFQSCDRALSYDLSWRLQSTIRLAVAREMGITLR